MFTEDGMYDKDEFVFLIYLKWNDQESMEDIKEAFMVFDKVLATTGTYTFWLYIEGYTFVYCNVAQVHVMRLHCILYMLYVLCKIAVLTNLG